MMPLNVHGVFAVYVMRPDCVGKKFELGLGGPRLNSLRMSIVFSANLLKKNQVSLHFPNRVVGLVQYKLTIPRAKAFVDVVREDF